MTAGSVPQGEASARRAGDRTRSGSEGRFGRETLERGWAAALLADLGRAARRSGERLFHDSADRRGATAAIRAAAETAVNLGRRARTIRPRVEAGSDIAVGQH